MTAELGVGELFMEQREEFVEHLYLFGRTVVFPRTHRVEAVRTLAALTSADGAGIGHTVLSVGTTWVMPQSALFLASAFVADADAPGIVLRGVTALDADGATVVQCAVTPHIQVVARIGAEVTRPVVTRQTVDGVVARWPGVGAVED